MCSRRYSLLLQEVIDAIFVVQVTVAFVDDVLTTVLSVVGALTKTGRETELVADSLSLELLPSSFTHALGISSSSRDTMSPLPAGNGDMVSPSLNGQLSSW